MVPLWVAQLGAENLDSDQTVQFADWFQSLLYAHSNLYPMLETGSN